MMKDKRMILSVMAVLLTQCCWSSHAAETGCNSWTPQGNEEDVCCESCNAGYRIFKVCGPNLEDLCKPCENGTFNLDPSKKSCTKCKQCGGVQMRVAACTRTTDTQCGCPSNLWCNNTECAICVAKCGRGREPESGTCRTCPDGTFNDQEHQKCKPLKSKCTHPGEHLIKGNAYIDSRCITEEEDTMLPWLIIITASSSTLLFPLILMIIVVKKLKGRKTGKPKNKTQQQLFVTTPTDEPRTLMAIECSFHEPEQVSSSDMLATEESEGSTMKLIV